MNRHPQWDQRLVELVNKRGFMSHDWGQHDCLLWPAAAVEAVTGEDFGAAHRGKYMSFASAYSYLKKLGFESAEQLLDSLFDVKPAAFAQRGDLVMADDGIPAVCVGAVALAIGQQGETQGLYGVARDRWVKAWAVGDHHSSWPDHV
jgi:hypothetical protein